MPIPGFKGYKIHLITREITNKFGTVVSLRDDNRGRLVVSLTRDNGKRTVAKVLDLLEKVFDSLELRKEQDSILSRVLTSYYTNLDSGISDLTLLEKSEIVAKDVPEAELLEIGKILDKIK